MGHDDAASRDYLAQALTRTDDLDAVIRLVARERLIRDAMAQTGEGRNTVTDMFDAMQAAGEDEILDLTDGEPTTLRDALSRYMDDLDLDTVVADLSTILNYPWSAEEERIQLHDLHGGLALHVEHYPQNERIVISMGDNRWPVYDGSTAREGGVVAGEVATAVYRGVLARVIADRDHHVQINGADALSLVQWATNSSAGSWSPDRSSRLSVDAVAGGGLLIRTRAYTYQQPGHAQLKEHDERARQQRTVDGIRPHKPVTAEEAKIRERYAQEELARPISQEQIARLLEDPENG
jgi:hypothetical protein